MILSKKEEIPPTARYDLVRACAYELLVEIKADKLPVNINDILSAFPHIKTIPYTEFNQSGDIPDSYNFDLINAHDYTKKEMPKFSIKWLRIHAFTIPSKETGHYSIYYDDRIEYEDRIRWSIACELGHIFVGHFIDFNINPSEYDNISYKQNDVLAAEAIWFASELLAPMSLLLAIREKLPSMRLGLFREYISLLCNIPDEFALKIIGTPKMAFECCPDNGSLFINPQMMLNFNQFIFNAEYWALIYKALRERLESRPQLIYKQFNLCRICKGCKAFVHNDSYTHCHYCGDKLETPEQFKMDRHAGLDQPILEGVVTPDFEETETSRALFCPRCKNHLIVDENKKCPVCRTPLYNRCSKHGKLSLECRRCPYCGKRTAYSGLYTDLKEIQITPPEWLIKLKYLKLGRRKE